MCIYICITLNDHVPRYLILILKKLILRDVDASYSIGKYVLSGANQKRKQSTSKKRSNYYYYRSMWLDKILRHCSDDVVLCK